MLKLNLYGNVGLATLSGCLWFLAVTPFDLSFLAWFAAFPMLLALLSIAPLCVVLGYLTPMIIDNLASGDRCQCS